MYIPSCFTTSGALPCNADSKPYRPSRRAATCGLSKISARRHPSRTRLSQVIGRLALVVGVAGVAAALPASASAQIQIAGGCKTALPHATLSLTANPTSTVSATSQGGTYFYNSPLLSCRRFIVDIGVPAGQNVSLWGWPRSRFLPRSDHRNSRGWYHVLPALAVDGLVVKDGRGWKPKDAA
jgi:hypothetical protein